MNLNFQRIEKLKALLDEDHQDSFILFALAKEYEKNQMLKIALDTYLQLKNNDYKYIGLYYHLGKLYENLFELENAMNTYNLGIIIAKELNDFHSLSELMTAKNELNMEKNSSEN